jgi:hypothetical protein
MPEVRSPRHPTQTKSAMDTQHQHPQQPPPNPNSPSASPNASHLITSNTLLLPTTARDMVARFAASKETSLARFDPAASLRDRHDLAVWDGDDDRFVDGEGRRSRFDVRQRRCRSGEGDGGEERYSELEELHCGLVVCLLACFLVLYCIVLSGVVVGTTVWS